MIIFCFLLLCDQVIDLDLLLSDLVIFLLNLCPHFVLSFLQYIHFIAGIAQLLL